MAAVHRSGSKQDGNPKQFVLTRRKSKTQALPEISPASEGPCSRPVLPGSTWQGSTVQRPSAHGRKFTNPDRSTFKKDPCNPDRTYSAAPKFADPDRFTFEKDLCDRRSDRSVLSEASTAITSEDGFAEAHSVLATMEATGATIELPQLGLVDHNFLQAQTEPCDHVTQRAPLFKSRRPRDRKKWLTAEFESLYSEMEPDIVNKMQQEEVRWLEEQYRRKEQEVESNPFRSRSKAESMTPLSSLFAAFMEEDMALLEPELDRSGWEKARARRVSMSAVSTFSPETRKTIEGFPEIKAEKLRRASTSALQ